MYIPRPWDLETPLGSEVKELVRNGGSFKGLVTIKGNLG